MSIIKNASIVVQRKSVTFLAEILLSLAEPDRAIRVLQPALKKWPDDINLIVALQKIYLANRDWTAYWRISERATSFSGPNNLWYKIMYATALLIFSRFNEALVVFKHCLEYWNLDERYDFLKLSTYATLGICYLYLEEWDKAQSYLQLAQKADQLDLNFVCGTIALLNATGRLDEIPDFLEELIEKHPKFYPLYYWKAHHLNYYEYNLPESLKWYQAALNRVNSVIYKNWYQQYYLFAANDAKPRRVLREYIEALIKCGHKTKALWLIYLYGAIGLQDNLDVTPLRISHDIWSGNHIRAERKCLAKLKTKTLPIISSEYWYLLALAQSKQGRAEDGIHNVSRALSIDSEHYNAQELKGELHIKVEDWESAIVQYQTLLKIDPFNPDWLENLGRCYVKTEDLEQAKTIYERVVKLDPYDAEAWVDLGSIYFHLGKNELGRSACERAMSFGRLDDNKQSEATKLLRAP